MQLVRALSLVIIKSRGMKWVEKICKGTWGLANLCGLLSSADCFPRPGAKASRREPCEAKRSDEYWSMLFVFLERKLIFIYSAVVIGSFVLGFSRASMPSPILSCCSSLGVRLRAKGPIYSGATRPTRRLYPNRYPALRPIISLAPSRPAPADPQCTTLIAVITEKYKLTSIMNLSHCLHT